jgi:ribosomal protein S18 acetylase RimI-like enzyme
VALQVRVAGAADHDAVAQLTVRVYRDDGYADDDYLDQLADVGHRAQHTELLAAVDDGRIVGSVSLAVEGGPYAEHSLPGEAVFRMLVVTPEARGRGVGAALVRACLERAAAAGCHRVVISTQPSMRAAHRLYERMGFTRLPERDWSPRPGVTLLVYARPLDDIAGHCDRCGRPADEDGHDECRAARLLEPPRFCPACGRRLVVQVTPTAWTATCREHGPTGTVRRRDPAGAARRSGRAGTTTRPSRPRG